MIMNAIVVWFLSVVSRVVGSPSASWSSHTGGAFINHSPNHDVSRSSFMVGIPRRNAKALRVSFSSTSGEESGENMASSKISFSPSPSELPSSKEWKAQTVKSGTLCEMCSTAAELTRIVVAGSGTVEATTRDGETKKEKVGPGAMVKLEGKDSQLLWTVKEGNEMLILSPGDGPLGAVGTTKALALLSFGFMLGFVFSNTF
uniref:Altered inheritance of mitochondria protein 24, mitochondrial n=1 Tax=Helicotheca tamesis TaxID=374047 RepID=A0A7S2N0C9_9STRA|mmetsp:Transcript_6980/g.9439  ORF Transcript_6980/g.9439 Transcript_6980/m.9439 type:complete len:202 (+) Transcript_6980:121-726(+)|eukprot:CAMPEP_0185734678 /NCGR_PEP_ID=MMETSP1171-20130828/23168_1 /TAXON_ID=374046 /ORGANISM="Helicotheca tamensis, Strain CCMP826" /LENGTH=201 /DNA_ID=CAMNT_0028404739 /DNA_START=91 /DNA_END=696 /DNA_ORIENTATION=-